MDLDKTKVRKVARALRNMWAERQQARVVGRENICQPSIAMETC